MLPHISHKCRWLLTSLYILLLCTTSLGFLPGLDEPPKEKRKIGKPMPSLKLLAAKEVAKLLQSNYMDTFDTDSHAVMAKFDLVVDHEIRACIANKLLKTYKAQITANNIMPGIELKKERSDIEPELAFNSDGSRLAYSDQQNIYIRNVHTGELQCLINTLAVGDRALGLITALCFDKKNKTLAVGYYWGSVRIYSIQDEPEQLHAFDELSNYKITCLRYYPDNTKLACGSCNGVIYIEDVISGELLQTFIDSGRRPVWDIGFIHDGGIWAQIGDSFFAFKRDGIIQLGCYNRWFDREVNFGNRYYIWKSEDPYLYDFNRNKLHKLFPKPHRSVCMSPNESMMAVAFDDGIQLYHMPALQDLSSSLFPVQALYIAKKLKEQNQSVISKAASSMMSTLYTWLCRRSNPNVEQEKKELFDSIHTSLPGKFKELLHDGDNS